jgi:excisionase family DNA binding protein
MTLSRATSARSSVFLAEHALGFPTMEPARVLFSTPASIFLLCLPRIPFLSANEFSTNLAVVCRNIPQKDELGCVHVGRFLARQETDRMSDRWLSMDEIAAHLGVSEDTIHRWIRMKEMPAHKVGRLWKFDKDEVDAWVRSGKAGKGK